MDPTRVSFTQTFLTGPIAMKTVQTSEAMAELPRLLDEVSRGETIVIAHHGRAVAHLVPAHEHDRDRIAAAMHRIRARRKCLGRITADEILSARDEGRK